MGTNYYAFGPEPQKCPTCDHTPGRLELHICKSLKSFQGYRGDDSTPYGEILSVDHWRGVLRGECGGPALEVQSEYGETIPVETFIAMVDATDRIERGRQFRWIVDHYPNPEHRRADWLDAEGFSFHGGDFS